MSRRLLVGAVLVTMGLPVAGYGLVTALGELGGMYQHAMDDPLDQPPGGEERDASSKILTSAVIGVIGAVPASIGLRLLMPRRRRRGG
ncbi:MAG TPA: hypothetical protein VK176_01720 [Phycisphaerales bacterium]|nr:hypothetical protein [Phycisphaerales bacterium]